MKLVNEMNNGPKYFGLLLTIFFFMVIFAPDYVGEAFAKSYSSRADLCGDHLCGTLEFEEGKKEAIENGAVLEIFDVDLLDRSGWYKVTFRVYAGNEEIPGALLQVTSDIFDKRIAVKRIPANTFDYLSVSIKADIPSTIKAELVF